MGFTGVIVLVVILIVAVVFGGTQISAFITDASQAYNDRQRDDATKAEPANVGDTLCTLTIDVEILSKTAVASVGVGTERILFTDGHADAPDKQIGWQWSDCYTYGGNSLVGLNLLDYLTADVSPPVLEWFIPSTPLGDEKIILTYILVDSNNGDVTRSIYEKVEYTHPAFQGEFTVEQKLKFTSIVAGDFTLEITPLESHFDNKSVGEAYKKSISAP